MDKGSHYTLEFRQRTADLASRIRVNRVTEQLGVSLVNFQRSKSRELEKRKPSSKIEI
ncbi:MAG: hypothetical protein K1X29_04395 [Bdellovibrionales bacterium]|nr:hypothetical protein [Bdellovibrionales bacterium]